MMSDPILEEVYQARQKLLEDCEGDLKKLLERLRKAESQDQHRVVSKSDVQAKAVGLSRPLTTQ